MRFTLLKLPGLRLCFLPHLSAIAIRTAPLSCGSRGPEGPPQQGVPIWFITPGYRWVCLCPNQDINLLGWLGRVTVPALASGTPSVLHSFGLSLWMCPKDQSSLGSQHHSTNSKPMSGAASCSLKTNPRRYLCLLAGMSL